MQIEKVYMGSMINTWMNKKNIKYVTFSVTDDCNLMCKYCYFTHKNTKNKMSFEVARKAVDYILTENDFLLHDGVVWDFIGGEPTLEMDLIDQICDYILYKMYSLNHKWLSCYRIMIGSNGLLYASKKFQDFLRKHKNNLHVNITVDGSKEKHDLSRIKKDGTGSYDDIVKILPLWFKQTGNYSTKATFSHADLPYLKDSIVNLWNLGFKNVMANVVFEDVWKDGDDDIYENQLRLLADYIIENKLWNQVSVRFFSPNIGHPLEDSQRGINFCGTGNMLAIDYRGNFYPCVRFMDSALNNKDGRIIGTAESGISHDKLRAFNALSYDVQSPSKCIDCYIASGCHWCSGLNYDESQDDSIYERKIYHCKMHHANVRANRYFWKRYEDITGNISPLRYNTYTAHSTNNRYLYIYNHVGINTCHIPNKSSKMGVMGRAVLEASQKYCEKNNLIPIFVGFKEKDRFGYYIGDQECQQQRDEMFIDFLTHESIIAHDKLNLANTILYSTTYDRIEDIYFDVLCMIEYKNISKINIVIKEYHKWDIFLLRKYIEVLNLLSDLIIDLWSAGRYIQIDIVTDNMFLSEKKNCSAGSNQWCVAPSGEIYSCIGEYMLNRPAMANILDFPEIESLSIVHKKLFMCDRCNVKQCGKCYVLNKELTCESDVPFEIHCIKSNLELEASVKIVQTLKTLNLKLPFEINSAILESKYLDPLIDLRGEDSFVNQKFYKIKELKV